MNRTLVSALLLGSMGVAQGLSAPASFAQFTSTSVIEDGTVGTRTEGIEGSFLTIFGGTINGDNLFHSFDTFSPDSLTPTYFWLGHPSYSGTADGITDVFARVTGSSYSYLNGYLTVLGGNNPNLFLLNANGILLGPDANIHIPGSLFLSTGESVLFEDGYRFSTADTATDSLLTISAPIGIQFGSQASLIQTVGFDMDENNATNGVTLLGGDIIVDSTSLEIFADHIQLGSVAENTQVAIDSSSHALTYAPGTHFKDIQIHNSRLDVDADRRDNQGEASGNLHLQGRYISINDSLLYADNAGFAEGGSIDITATESVAIAGSRITADVLQGNIYDEQTQQFWLQPSTGTGGDITITADDLTIGATTKISTSTESEGAGGDIRLSANRLLLQGEVDHGELTAPSSVRILANTLASGQGGSVVIQANDFSAVGDVSIGTLSTIEAGIFPPTDGQYGNGGDLIFDVGAMTLRNGVQLLTATNTNGDAGDLNIRADNIFLYEDLDPSLYGSVLSLGLNANTSSLGDGGNISIQADSLFSTGVAYISSASNPNYYSANGDYGNGGLLSIDVDSLHLEKGTRILTSTFYGGDAGDLSIRADDITLIGETGGVYSNNVIPTTIAADSIGGGVGGQLTVQADTVEAIGTVGITAFAYAGYEDDIPDSDGGDLSIDVGRLVVRDGAQVGTSTFGGGNAGSLTIVASEGVTVSDVVVYEQLDAAGSNISFAISTTVASSSGVGAMGNGGALKIVTPDLSVNDGAKVTAETRGRGNAGSISIEASDIVVSDVFVDDQGVPSGIVAVVALGSVGEGGPIDIVSDRIRLTNGGQITAATAGQGNAGNISVQANVIDIEGVSVDGQSSSSISSQSATAFDAGSVTITGIDGDTQNRINIRDYGAISVSNIAGGRAGNVDISAGRVELRDNGSIQAEANAGAEGNVTIESRDVLLLRDRSTITTNAMGTATGGNITLNAPTIVGLGNSDISANAVEGNGGNIQLITQGLIGLEFRDDLTPGNDITASSETGTNGTVQIKSPEVDPDSGLTQLSETVVNMSDQVAASCAAQDRNQFVSTGRGGLPDSPLHVVINSAPLQDLGAFVETGVGARAVEDKETMPVRVRESEEFVAHAAPESALQEASQWQLNETGEVELLAAGSVVRQEMGCLAQTMAIAP